MTSDDNLATQLAKEAIKCLEYGKIKIEHCLKQLNDGQVWWRPQPNMNSIGNLLLHLAGNLNQWIVAGVGDANDTRHRQSEFDERRPIPKAEVEERLFSVLRDCDAALRSVSSSDFMLPKRVQGYDVTKLNAMMHSVTHFQGHVQEIICLTRQQLGDRYEFQWEPKTVEEGA